MGNDDNKQLAVFGAQITSDGAFKQLIVNLASYGLLVKGVKVVDAETMHHAIDLRAKVKKDYATWEDLRKRGVALPNAMSKFVNDLVREPKKQLEGWQRNIGEQIQKQKQIEEEKARKEAEDVVEAKIEAENGVEIVVTGGVSVVDPPNVVRTDNGATVHTRGVPKVQVDDKLEFLKAVVSKAKKNEVWGLEMVDVKLPQVKERAKELAGDKKQLKIPGGKYWVEDVLV